MDILKTLVDTPLPTLLVVAGLFFIFVALGGRFGAKIVTDQVRPTAAGMLGLILLVAGVAMFLLPVWMEPGPGGGQPKGEIARPVEPRPGAEGARGREMPAEADVPEGRHPELEAHIRDIEHAIMVNEAKQRSVRGELEELRGLVKVDPGARAPLEERKHILEQLGRENEELHQELDRVRAAR